MIFKIGLLMFLIGVASTTYYQGEFILAVFSIIPEIIVCLTIISMLNHNKKRIWRYFSGVLFFLYWFIFCIQWGFYAHSGEFISTLALENINQLYLVVNYKYCIPLFAIVIIGVALTRYIVKMNQKCCVYVSKRISYWLILFSVNIMSLFFIIGQYNNVCRGGNRNTCYISYK